MKTYSIAIVSLSIFFIVFSTMCIATNDLPDESGDNKHSIFLTLANQYGHRAKTSHLCAIATSGIFGVTGFTCGAYLTAARFLPIFLGVMTAAAGYKVVEATTTDVFNDIQRKTLKYYQFPPSSMDHALPPTTKPLTPAIPFHHKLTHYILQRLNPEQWLYIKEAYTMIHPDEQLAFMQNITDELNNLKWSPKTHS
ncbi:MAG: hypothetical protein WBQ73_01305 [Candidatus Babeliales bacterium]